MNLRWTTGLAALVCLSIGAPAAFAAESSPPPAVTNPAAVADPYPSLEELVMGAGSRGPYLLSWTNVTPATEAVSLNGKRIHHGLDYTLDYAKGTIQFGEPLDQGDVVQVAYRYDRALAKPNPSATRLPLALKVWQSGNGSLQLIGLMPPNPNAPGSAPVLGLTAETSRSGSRLSSLFLINTTPAEPGTDSWDRAALRLGGTTAWGALKLNGSYLQAGSQFAGAPDPTLAAGLRHVDLSLAYDPSQRLSFSSKVDRMEALSDAQQAQERSLESHRLAVTPTKSSRLTLTRDVRGGPQGKDQTTSLSLNTRPTDRLKVNSHLSRRTSERDGALDVMGFDWDARAAKWIGLDGTFTHQTAEKIGQDDAQRLRLSLGPLRVEGQRRERDAIAGPDEMEELLRLEAGLLRGVRLGGGRGNRVAGPEQAVTDLSEAFVEIAPVPALRLRGSMQSAVTGDLEARTTAVSAALKARRLLELAGSYRAREADDRDALISRDYTLALRPVRGLTLQGAYHENPEDPNGRILDQVHTTLGLQSQVGFVGLSGAYTEIETGLLSRGAEELELKLTLGFAAKTKLYSGYKEREAREGSLLRDRTFSLGFTRTVGDSLFLLLEGEYTLSERDGEPRDDAGDTRANARLGLRF